LPFSSKTWGEFILDQKQVSMMKAVENVFYAFGGTTHYAVFDNLMPTELRGASPTVKNVSVSGQIVDFRLGRGGF
jgi:hypothetical protein